MEVELEVKLEVEVEVEAEAEAGVELQGVLCVTTSGRAEIFID